MTTFHLLWFLSQVGAWMDVQVMWPMNVMCNRPIFIALETFLPTLAILFIRFHSIFHAPMLNVHNLSWMETYLLSGRLKAFSFHVFCFFFMVFISFFFCSLCWTHASFYRHSISLKYLPAQTVTWCQFSKKCPKDQNEDKKPPRQAGNNDVCSTDLRKKPN